MSYKGPFDACIGAHSRHLCIPVDVLSFLFLLEPSISEVCSVESFRAALGTSCTGAIAVINAIGKSIAIANTPSL